MSSITISVVNSKSDLMKFIKFPWKVYKRDEHWVPPLIMDRKKVLDKTKNPFFKHADMEMYLAFKDGKIAGRIAAIKNDIHNRQHNDKVGFFGFFECIDDQEVANKLFDTAKVWLKEKGFDSMRGPTSPSTNDEWGMLLEGFNDAPRILMPYNPPYYLKLCNNYGFQKAMDPFAWKLENNKVISSEKLKRVAELAKKRSGMKISQLNLKEFDKEIAKVKYVYNKAWEPNWGFIPMSDEELDMMAADLKQIVEPSLVLWGEIDEKLVGFALVLPDYNTVFKEMNGRLFPFGFLKMFTKKKDIKWCRIITLGIIPEFQKRGLDAVFYWEIVNRAHDLGYDLGEASWVLETNDMMNRGAEMMNGECYKKYRAFEIAI